MTRCQHRRQELKTIEVAQAGLDTRRVWIRCVHPQIGPHQCRCKCGPKCPGFEKKS